MTNLGGVFCAIVTPFHEDESLNLEALTRQVRRQAAAGNNIFCAGTNGEFFSLSSDEKRAVAEACVAAAEGQAKVLAHIGEPSTRATIALGREVQATGVSAVSVVTPFVVPCTQEELYTHYVAVADALSVPVYIYNIPSRTGNTVAPETAARLGRHGNIAGIKDSAGSAESLDGFLAVRSSTFGTLVGPDSLILHGLKGGAEGCVSGLSNICPDTVQGIFKAFVAGDLAEAEMLQQRLGALRKQLFSAGFGPAQTKRALRHVAPEVGPSRAPISILEEVDDTVATLAREFAERLN
ncbi:dihydrodipicolinate synthase family protein [Consotaella salsifontis]|uniref:4-hydroxy-tetrahydrodipicolinate synthase n=1 Tax=Consotaella salsifontis TaxID=1365950 RepID=A0A1T4T1M2_9HYPH|nr:dihydrodipicolinate synthase family protein [Consotaella salsifontis]SKA34353.1 4-hydroxy-tetrahydrodipicolinate synthase [Consotaella salsifontis]